MLITLMTQQYVPEQLGTPTRSRVVSRNFTRRRIIGILIQNILFNKEGGMCELCDVSLEAVS